MISIHAPQWGATVTYWISPVSVTAFQSTHPSGVRRAGTVEPDTLG